MVLSLVMWPYHVNHAGVTGCLSIKHLKQTLENCKTLCDKNAPSPENNKLVCKQIEATSQGILCYNDM